MDKRTLGVLGLGSRTTLFYVRELNRLYKLEKGGDRTCPFILLNTDFDAINSLLPNTSAKLDGITHHYVQELEKMDINHLLIPNITLHETIDRLAMNKKIIHPLHSALSILKRNNDSKIVLFGSLHSMKSSYIHSFFELHNIETILPSQEDMLRIDEVRKLVYSETETEEIIAAYHLLLEKYSQVNPVVLACTELSLVLPKKKNIRILDMARIQIAEAIERIL